MDKIIESITEWLKEFFIGAIQTNLSTMFNDVNTKVGTIAGEVGQTPQGWNSGIFNMIKNLSDNVILPIAGIIITYVLCYELIHMVMEKNHGNDMEFWEFFVYFVPTSVGSWKKQENSTKTSTFASLTMQKPLTVWITKNYGKFLKRWVYQTTLLAS